MEFKIKRYRLREDACKLADVGGQLPPGEIIDTGRGVVLLACPACTKIQFAAGTVMGPPDNPHLATAVHCGNGYCKRCGIWFRIMNGRPQALEPQERKRPRIPELLKRNGVTPPPPFPGGDE
jgi:uncharacterized protein YbaR (Trm112 family)